LKMCNNPYSSKL